MNDLPFRAGARLWHVLFWLCLTGAAVLALMPHPPRIATGEFADKFEHMLAFAVLAAVAQVAFPKVPRLRLWVLLALFGAAIEVFQFVPGLNRDGNLSDWIVDGMVAALVLAVPGWLSRSPAAPPAKG